MGQKRMAVSTNESNKKQKNKELTLQEKVHLLRQDVTALSYLPSLLQALQDTDSKQQLFLMHALQSLFEHWMTTDVLQVSKRKVERMTEKAEQTQEPKALALAKRTEWLHAQWQLYLDSLHELVRNSNVSVAVQVPALRLLTVSVLDAMTRESHLQQPLCRILDSLIESQSSSMQSSIVHADWIRLWIEKDEDHLIASFLAKHIARQMQDNKVTAWDQMLRFLLALSQAKQVSILAKGTENEAEEEKNDKTHSRQRHVCRSALSDAWLALLRYLPVSAQTKETWTAVMARLRKVVMPLLIDPSRLLDLLSDCYGQPTAEPALRWLALDSLFVLMRDYHLDFPHFYEQLYAMLTAEMHSQRYKERAYQLVTQCLSSPLLPAYVVAAFIRRLSRLALFASPLAIAWTISLCYNTIQQHAVLKSLIDDGESEIVSHWTDPYDAEEKDPAQSDAVSSSLHALYSMTQHWQCTLRHLSEIWESKLQKPRLPEEEVHAMSYEAMFSSSRCMKSDQVLEAPLRAIPVSTFAGPILASL